MFIRNNPYTAWKDEPMNTTLPGSIIALSTTIAIITSNNSTGFSKSKQ